MGDWHSRAVKHFHGRVLLEPATPAGYSALIDRFDLTLPLPPKLAAISDKHRRRDDGQWLALLLAAIGIYSVLSYVVSQRRREIGIRVAMGASTAQVVGLIWKGGVMLTAMGAAAGMVLAALTTGAMASLLHGVEPLDPVAFIAAPVLLMIVASFAALIPAVRATRVDPVRALRAE